MANDLSAFRETLSAIGDNVAALRERASNEQATATPEALALATVINDLITTLRCFPDSLPTWRSVGEIAEHEVIPSLIERMTRQGRNPPPPKRPPF